LVLVGRIVLIGDAGVGKTSIVHYYLHGTTSIEQKSTIGAVFHTSTVNTAECEVQLQIWDTAGQERYRALGPIYYRKARAAVAVFDLTRPETKRALETWIRSFREHSDDRFVVIAANKSDLEDHELTMEQTAEWAQSLDSECIWTSAVTGVGVAEVFEAVAKHIAEEATRPSDGDFEQPLEPIRDEPRLEEVAPEPQEKCC
jgi:small GTP-binding protein